MSCSFDVKVPLYASDRSSKFHEAANRFLESCAARPDLARHPRIFDLMSGP